MDERDLRERILDAVERRDPRPPALNREDRMTASWLSCEHNSEVTSDSSCAVCEKIRSVGAATTKLSVQVRECAP